METKVRIFSPNNLILYYSTSGIETLSPEKEWFTDAPIIRFCVHSDHEALNPSGSKEIINVSKGKVST